MLMLRRDISVGAFIGTIAGTVFPACIMPISNTSPVKYALVTNMVLFAAVYIISDRRIAPQKEYYAFFYGLFIAVFSYIVVLTTGKENAVVIISVLFTPVALGFRNLEKKIALAHEEVFAIKHEAVLVESEASDSGDEEISAETEDNGSE